MIVQQCIYPSMTARVAPQVIRYGNDDNVMFKSKCRRMILVLMEDTSLLRCLHSQRGA